MKALLIVNPISGTSSTAKQDAINAAEHMLPQAGIELDIAYTESRGHATELAARAARAKVPIIIAAGGDGTVNETAQGLVFTNSTMGILPCGSGNGLARHLSIPMKPEKAVEVIIRGREEKIDYCTANDEAFFCTFGMGFDAAVSDRFASRPDRRGLRNYVRAAIEVFLSYKRQEYEIITPTGKFHDKAFVVACCNASQYGNDTFIAPWASVTDGMIDVTILKSRTWLGHLISGAQTMLGSLSESGRVAHLRAPEVVIKRRPGPSHLDGEVASLGEEIHVKCLNGALKVFTPGEMKVKPFWRRK